MSKSNSQHSPKQEFMVTAGRKRSRQEGAMQRPKWLPPQRLAESTTALPSFQGQGAIPGLKTFYLEENKTKNHSRKKGQGKKNTVESQAADLRRITKSPR